MTKQMSRFTKYEPKSLASIIESENADARGFINYSCGNVIMVDDPMDLEKYSTSITNDGLIYRGYTVTNLNPNVEKPFMGKNAASKSQEIWQERARNVKDEYIELNEQQEILQAEVALLEQIDIRPLIEDLDKALMLQKEKFALEDLMGQVQSFFHFVQCMFYTLSRPHR